MSNLYSCISPRVLTNPAGNKIFVGCGRCSACRARRRTQVVSLMNDYKKVYRYCEFFTLTYNEENVPIFELPDGSFIHVLQRSDAQKFLKRLRRNIEYFNLKNNISYEQTRFSYFICGEYGPQTLRPHLHGIIFHNSRYFAENCNSILRKVWKFGFIDTSPRRSDECFKYVAKYINKSCSCLENLGVSPEIYKQVRPFLLHSVSLYKKEFESFKEEFERIIDGRFDKRVLAVDGRSSSQPLSNYVKNELFPKCREFSNLSFHELVGRYSIAFRYSTFSEYRETLDIDSYPSFDVAKLVFNRAKQDYHISRKFKINCLDFGLTPDSYLQTIVDFYNKKDYCNLRDFLAMLEQRSQIRDLDFSLLYVDTFNYWRMRSDSDYIEFRNESHAIEENRQRTKKFNDIYYSSSKF